MSSVWSSFIFLSFFGGLAALYALVVALSKRKVSSSTDETQDEPHVEGTGHVWDGDLRELDNPLPAWWRTMFFITIAWALIYACLFPSIGESRMFLGWTSKGQYEAEMAAADDKYGKQFAAFLERDIASLSSDPKALRMGERLFASYCTQCHGSDARGARGFPNLADNEWQWGADPDAIKQSILNGRTAVMPPWEAIIGKEGVTQVSAYVRGLSGQGVDAKIAQAGAALYKKNCVACHGANGEGNPILGAPNLADNIWLYGSDVTTIERSIANGRRGNMPAHKEFLGEAKVHLLAAYVYHLGALSNIK